MSQLRRYSPLVENAIVCIGLPTLISITGERSFPTLSTIERSSISSVRTSHCDGRDFRASLQQDHWHRSRALRPLPCSIWISAHAALDQVFGAYSDLFQVRFCFERKHLEDVV